MSISATLSHSFDVSRFGSCSEDEDIDGPVQLVMHNMVHLDFKLSVTPKDSRPQCADYLGIYVDYVGGPQDKVPLYYGMLVAVNGRLVPVFLDCHQKLKKGRGFGSNKHLPRTVEALAEQCYLCQNNTHLHVVAQLNIPLSAFEDPSKSHRVVVLSFLEAKQAGHIGSLQLSLFQELKTPVAIESAKSERIQIKGKEETWWAHKRVLSLASEVFAGWFDPDKPEEALNESLKKGKLEWTDLSDDVIQHMLYVIYLGCTGEGFDELAWEIVDPAEKFKIKHLKELCQQSLIQQLDKMSVDDLFTNLVQADKFDLAQLKSSAAAKLCQSTAAIELEPDKFMKMLFDVHRLKLDQLNEWCAKWMKKNCLQFKVQNLMEKAEDGQAVLEYLIQAICTTRVQDLFYYG